MRYGIANREGQPDAVEATELVRGVWSRGVRHFDTAQGYGSSEAILGKALADIGAGESAKVISKIQIIPDGPTITALIKESLSRLNMRRLSAVLLHNEDELNRWRREEKSREPLRAAVASGLTERIGASIYDPLRAEEVLTDADLTVIQVPANLFDRRLSRSDFFKRAADAGKQMFVRSVYLQGLALMPADGSTPKVKYAVEAIAMLERFCVDRGVSRAKFALDYVRHRCAGAKIILGAETAAQAIANTELFTAECLPLAWCDEWDQVWPDDHTELIDPRRWPTRL